MGITVTSSTAINAASATPASTVAGDAAAAGDFAALLVQQLLGTAPSGTSTGLQMAVEKASEGGKPESSDEDTTTAQTGDASLLPFLMPAIVAPAAAQAAPPATAAAAGNDNGSVGAAQAHLTPGELQLPPTASTSAANALEAAPSALGSGNPASETAKFAVSGLPTAENNSNLAALAGQTVAAAQPHRAEQTTQATPPAPSTPFSHPDWGKDFGDSVVWMSRNNLQSAQISLNPPHLGPVQITLNVSGDQATAVFASPHAEVRQAISDAMPQLREMLAGSGINLGQANVGAQLQQQTQQNDPQASGSGRFASDNAILQGTSAVEEAASPSLVRRGRGLVDLFA